MNCFIRGYPEHVQNFGGKHVCSKIKWSAVYAYAQASSNKPFQWDTTFRSVQEEWVKKNRKADVFYFSLFNDRQTASAKLASFYNTKFLFYL